MRLYWLEVSPSSPPCWELARGTETYDFDHIKEQFSLRSDRENPPVGWVPTNPRRWRICSCEVTVHKEES